MDDARGAGAPRSVADADLARVDALGDLLALPGVRRVGLALSEGGGRRLRFTATDRDPEGGVDWCHIDAYDDVPLTTVVRTGEAIAADLDDLDGRYAGMVAHQREQQVLALAALPLSGGGPPIGGVVLFYGERQAFDAAQRRDLDRRAALLARTLLALQTQPSGSSLRSPTLAATAVGPDVLVADTVVAGEPSAVGGARRFLRGRLRAWGVDDGVADTAVLCLSELVTNAVIHTGAASEVRATLAAGVLTVTVRDAGTGRAGDRRDGSDGSDGSDGVPDPLRVHGRGLQLVAALSARWGSDVAATGTTVWFELAAAG